MKKTKKRVKKVVLDELIPEAEERARRVPKWVTGYVLGNTPGRVLSVEPVGVSSYLTQIGLAYHLFYRVEYFTKVNDAANRFDCVIIEGPPKYLTYSTTGLSTVTRLVNAAALLQTTLIEMGTEVDETKKLSGPYR